MSIHGRGSARSKIGFFLSTGAEDSQSCGNDEELEVDMHTYSTAHFRGVLL
jgi:hypothetical protein